MRNIKIKNETDIYANINIVTIYLFVNSNNVNMDMYIVRYGANY